MRSCAVALRGRQALRRGRHLARDPGLADAALQGEVVGQRQRAERPGLQRELLGRQAGEPGRRMQRPQAALLADMRSSAGSRRAAAGRSAGWRSSARSAAA